mgnify:FL=1
MQLRLGLSTLRNHLILRGHSASLFLRDLSLRDLGRRPARLVLFCALALGAPGSSPFAAAEDFDVALHGGATPVGEVSAGGALGGVSLAARHSEYLGYLNRGYREDGEENPLLRRTELAGRTTLEVTSGMAMPLGVKLALEERAAGERDLRISGRSGLRLGAFRIDHGVTVTTSFAADGSQTRLAQGRLVLGMDFFGGVQQGIVEYDALPIGQVTLVGLNSDWVWDGGGAVVAGLSHRPLDRLSEARFGLRHRVGSFDMTSSFAADNQGAFSLGISFALDLGEAAEPATWRLSSMLDALQAQAQPPLAPQSSGLLSAAN